MPEQAKDPEGWGRPLRSQRWHFWPGGDRWSACKGYTRVDLGHRIVVVAPPADECCRNCKIMLSAAERTIERSHELVDALAGSRA